MGNPCAPNLDPHLAYLDAVHLSADDTTPDLLEILTNLCTIVRQSTQHPISTQWNQYIYAAALLTTTVDLLRARSVQPLDHLPANSAELIHHPIQWTATQILLSPTGEKHLPQILRVYDHMQLTDKHMLLHNLLTTLGKRELITDITHANAEMRQRHEARQLLDQISDAETVAQKQNLIDCVVWFRHVGLSAGHLLEVLLVEAGETDHYDASCLVYGAWLSAMKEEQSYARVFWDRLLAECADGCGEALFHRCCRLTHFYEVLVEQIRTYLTGVRPVDVGGDVEWMGDRLEFVQVSRVVCLLLDGKSNVRERFAEHLNEFGLDVRLRRDLFQFALYD